MDLPDQEMAHVAGEVDIATHDSISEKQSFDREDLGEMHTGADLPEDWTPKMATVPALMRRSEIIFFTTDRYSGGVGFTWDC